MKTRVACCTAVLILLAVFFGQASNELDKVEFAELSPATWQEFAPRGKEVDAIYGDVVLRNRYLTAVIAKPVPSRHANMTVRDVGGALIDLSTREQSSDQISAFYPGKRGYPFRSWHAVSEKNGKHAEVTVIAESVEGRPRVEVTYQLEAGKKWLNITTRYINQGNAPITVQLIDDIRADSGKEYMPKAPNGTATLYWMHDRFWGQAYGVAGDNLEITSNSNTRTSTLRYRPVGGSDKVDIEAGRAFELTRRVFPATNLIDIKAIHAELRGTVTHPTRFLVKDAIDRPVPQAMVMLKQNGKTVGSGRATDDGKFACNLPPGEYQALASADGVAMFKEPLPVRVVKQGSPQSFELQSTTYFTGTVNAKINDSKGQPIPCKVEFLAKDGTPQPDFGPESGEFAVKSLRYTADGRFSQRLPTGSYNVVISRGPEYDAVSLELTVLAGQSVPLQATLDRVVKTPGWISSDFHSHSSPSGDNTGSQFGRVLNLVCEHVEFAPCTEHNRVSTYEPHIKRLGIEKYISTVSGMELTGRPLPLNHQNVFPIIHKFGRQDGGGPVTDTSPETQIERVALWDNRSEKLVQQNHPDPGWLFYDRNGDGKPDGGFERAFPFMNVMEIHPIEAALVLGPNYTYPTKRPFHNRVFNWLQLLNQGVRIYGVVNTDAHYNFHGSSSVRNWVRSPTDDPAEIKHSDVVQTAKQGGMVMSNGPYLEASLVEDGKTKRVISGQDIEVHSGAVTLSVRVQAANWVGVDRLFVLINGRVHKLHNYNRTDHPHRFRAGTVRFEAELQLKLKSDAHVIVVCGSDKPLGPNVVGSFWGNYRAAAISNPIFVDVDGNGFTANKDTLDHPLPVKFGSR